MKICTITCHRAENHGARLQTFALAEYLRGLGHEVEVIDYRPWYQYYIGLKWYNPGFDIKEWIKVLTRYRKRVRDMRRHDLFVAFSDRYVPTTDTVYCSVDDLMAHPPKADAYIAGSDQIWNTSFQTGRDAAYYLAFGTDDVLKVSYAGSFATKDIIDGYKDFVSENLRNIDAISVRESSAKRIVEGLGLKAVQVCDPVMLLPESFWCGDFMEKPVIESPYLLVYDFEKSEAVRKVAKRIARLKGLKIVSVAPDPLSYADKNFVVCSPNEFVGLVHGAQCVVSNSFHGTVYAMIFSKDFIVVPRADGLNQRMLDLLDRYDMAERIVTPESDDKALTQSIDYAPVQAKMAADIAFSKQWLADTLHKK